MRGFWRWKVRNSLLVKMLINRILINYHICFTAYIFCSGLKLYSLYCYIYHICCLILLYLFFLPNGKWFKVQKWKYNGEEGEKFCSRSDSGLRQFRSKGGKSSWRVFWNLCIIITWICTYFNIKIYYKIIKKNIQRSTGLFIVGSTIQHF